MLFFTVLLSVGTGSYSGDSAKPTSLATTVWSDIKWCDVGSMLPPRSAQMLAGMVMQSGRHRVNCIIYFELLMCALQVPSCDLLAGHGHVDSTSRALHQTGMPSSSGMQAGEQHDHYTWCLL